SFYPFHIHFFPTRRSSDLPDTDSRMMRSPSRKPSSRARERLMMTPRWPAMLLATSLIIGSPTFEPHAYCIERAVNAQNGNSFGSDRKSTRLNSSHVKISYA